MQQVNQEGRKLRWEGWERGAKAVVEAETLLSSMEFSPHRYLLQALYPAGLTGQGFVASPASGWGAQPPYMLRITTPTWSTVTERFPVGVQVLTQEVGLPDQCQATIVHTKLELNNALWKQTFPVESLGPGAVVSEAVRRAARRRRQWNKAAGLFQPWQVALLVLLSTAWGQSALQLQHGFLVGWSMRLLGVLSGSFLLIALVGWMGLVWSRRFLEPPESPFAEAVVRSTPDVPAKRVSTLTLPIWGGVIWEQRLKTLPPVVQAYARAVQHKYTALPPLEKGLIDPQIHRIQRLPAELSEMLAAYSLIERPESKVEGARLLQAYLIESAALVDHFSEDVKLRREREALIELQRGLAVIQGTKR